MTEDAEAEAEAEAEIEAEAEAENKAENKNEDNKEENEEEAKEEDKEEEAKEAVWIPIRVEWREPRLDPEESMAKPAETNATIADDTPLVHPIARKLLNLYNIIKTAYPDSKMKSKNTELDKTTLEKKWSVNKIKSDFEYHFHPKSRRLVVTLWIQTGKPRIPISMSSNKEYWSN